MGNPFYERGMIKERDDFFGRASELARTFDRLRVMQSVSVVGQRRIGKSSFLYRLARPAPDELDAGYTCRYLDMQRMASASEFYERAVAALRRPDGETQRDEGQLDRRGGATHRDLERAIEGKKAVLCLDEFEHTANNPQFDVDFFSALRSLAQTGNLALVVATQTPLPELSYRGAIKTSPFFNIFSPLPLESLTEAEARRMLAALSARGGRPFDDGEMDWIIALAGMHPWRLQVLAYHLFEAQEGAAPDRAEVERRYREEIQAGKPLASRPPEARGAPDRSQRFKPWLVFLTVLTILAAFLLAPLSGAYGVYVVLILAVVTIGLTAYAYRWPGSRRSQ